MQRICYTWSKHTVSGASEQSSYDPEVIFAMDIFCHRSRIQCFQLMAFVCLWTLILLHPVLSLAFVAWKRNEMYQYIKQRTSKKPGLTKIWKQMLLHGFFFKFMIKSELFQKHNSFIQDYGKWFKNRTKWKSLVNLMKDSKEIGTKGKISPFI